MKYYRKKFKNGLRVLMIPMEGAPTVTFIVAVNAGSHHESRKENGISHFLEHMSFQGTKNRPTNKNIRKDLDGIGAINNAFTWNEYTGYYAKAHPDNLKNIIDVISDMYLNSTIPIKEIEKERGVVLGEIDMYQDNPKQLLAKLWREMTYGDQPAGRTVLGFKENIKNFKQKDFIDYKNKHYIASSTVIVVAGKFNQKDVLKEVEKHFKDIKVGKKPTKLKVKDYQNKQKLLVRYKKTDQTHLILGFRSINLFSSEKEKATLNILDTILGGNMSSRLWVKVREELGLGYYVQSSTNLLSDYGHLTISAGVNSDKIGEAVSAILGEIKKLKEELVSTEELKDAKKYFIGTYPMSLEQSDAVATHFMHTEVLNAKPEIPNNLYKEINKVTAEDLRVLANEIFKNNKMNLAILGPHQDSKKISKIFKI
jgi:predicted Zn-dependent peptidase